ncbi:hypothetical protein DXG01_015892 [Tephrocybe rancida]|nr:hypothetical protein DXG01_015892 [Tephrocybe rancida]
MVASRLLGSVACDKQHPRFRVRHDLLLVLNHQYLSMAYPHYTPPAGTHPTSTTYPYYHPAAHTAYVAHPQTPGAYPYNPPYQTGVTSYGWPYPYAWPHPAQQSHTPTPAPQAPAPAVAHPPVTPTVAQAPAKPTTFTSYTPSYIRESVAAASSGGATGRGSRKQSTKGLFTKELKSIMYGFGDDRNPANDTVNVMEEILVEYITDVVRQLCIALNEQRTYASHQCTSAGNSSRKTRLSIDDLRRALSRPADAKKLARMEELLFMQEDIKRARAQFDDNTNPTEF